MTDLGFWIASLGVPLAALMINVLIRRLFKLPQSALADLILVIVVFDALVIIQHDDFARFVKFSYVKQSVVAAYVVLLMSDMVVWFIAVTKLETKMNRLEQNNSVKSNIDWLVSQFVSGVLATLVLFTSIVPFAYKGAVG